MNNKKQVSTISSEQFRRWAKPRRGAANPEVITNTVWVELIKTNHWPHKAHKLYGSGEKQSPGWCFDRYGKSDTILPDGTTVYIGGEHEDYYDEDFYIYNDVIVKALQGEIIIYSYPEDVFPPTDSHTATLVGNKIYIIGCIGYPEQRDYSDTPVYVLSLKDYSIEKLSTHGDAPHWLYKHKAKYIMGDNAIYCEYGEVQNTELNECVENLATWRLCLKSGLWSCIEIKPWTRWRLARADEQRNHLYDIGSLESASRRQSESKYDAETKAKLLALNYPLDFNKYKARYSPPIKHEIIESDEYRRHLILIDGVVICYDETSWGITVTIEGNLPATLISTLKSHSLTVFSEIEATENKIIEL